MRCSFDFNLKNIEFVLTEISLTQLLVKLYNMITLHQASISFQFQKFS